MEGGTKQPKEYQPIDRGQSDCNDYYYNKLIAMIAANEQASKIRNYAGNRIPKEVVQRAVYDGLIELIKKGEVITTKYLKLADDQTRQEVLLEGIRYAVRLGRDIPDSYIENVEPHTLQRALYLELRDFIKSGLAIKPQHLKLVESQTLQKVLFEGIEYRVSRGLDIPENYMLLADHSIFQQALRQGILKLMETAISGEDILKYFSQADIDTSREISELIGRDDRIRGDGILQYLRLADDDTIAFLRSDQELCNKILQRQILMSIIQGHSFEEYLQAYLLFIPLSPENIQHILEEEEFVKKALIGAVGNFFVPTAFASTLHRFGREREHPLSSEIQTVVEELSPQERLRALYDRTLLPIGLKIHTESNPLLDEVLEKTGGFIASGKKECYVANPVANAYIVELALKALQKKLVQPREAELISLKRGLVSQLNELERQNPVDNKENKKEEARIKSIKEEIEKIEVELKNTRSGEYNPFPPKTYFQVCVPYRLDNEACGIATIAFLLARKNILKYTPELIKHNQNTIGVTIYDAGGNVVGKHFVPTEDGNGAIPYFDGRTDMLLCGGIEDIKTAHLILSLLVHARYENIPLAHQKLGELFIEEVYELLYNENVLDWLDNTFVNLKDREEIDRLGKVLIAIYNLRLEREVNPKMKEYIKYIKEYNKKVENYNAGMSLYEREKSDPRYQNNQKYFEDFLKRLEESRNSLEELRNKVDQLHEGLNQFLYQSLPFSMKKLIQKYFSLVYPEGKYISELEVLKGRIKNKEKNKDK